MANDMKPRSREVTDGYERAPARAMLRAIGMTDDDWDKPQVGVASSWNEVTPCNMPLDRLAKQAKEGVREAGGYPIEFVTIAVSDGISMGGEGMRASLVSREVIADSVETVMHAERFDAMVTFAGCDKSLPGMLMAAARLDLPAVFLYGGSILPGQGPHGRGPRHRERVRGGRGQRGGNAHRRGAGRSSSASACPTVGSCAGMFTANTMASVSEALGMALPGSASPPAVDPRRDDLAYESGRAVVRLLEAGIRPRQIMTKEAFENAIAVTMALGGSTNAVLHLLAIAHEARVDLSLDDFDRIGRRVPHIADTKPHGRYHMVDVDRRRRGPGGDAGPARGRPPPRRLPDRHRPNGGREPGEPRSGRDPTGRSSTRCPTPSTPTAASPSCAARWRPKGRWSRWPASTRIGSRAWPGSSTARTRPWRPSWPGPSRPARSWSSATRGPKGGPGMREMLAVTGRHEGRRAGGRLRPGHRRSLQRGHPRLLRRPRRTRGGRRRPDRAGRRRRPDRHRRAVEDHRPPGRRRLSWIVGARAGSVPAPRYPTGVLAKYARLVTGAERGAVTEP